MITLSQLQDIMPLSGPRAPRFIEPMNEAMPQYEINTGRRQAAFLAQVAHESGELKYVRELATGWDYEGRKDLGNHEIGDGPKFKGRGLLQITGRGNYRACGEALGLDLIANPYLLEEPLPAVRSACWFWAVRKLNALADEGDLVAITKRINGGTNGLAQRRQYYERALKVLGVDQTNDGGPQP